MSGGRSTVMIRIANGFWRHWAEARRRYREAMRRAFGRPVNDPWPQMRRGLVLGGEEQLAKAGRLIGRKSGRAEARWTETSEAAARRERVRRLEAAAQQDMGLQKKLDRVRQAVDRQ